MKQVTNLFRTWIAAVVAVLAFPAVAQTVYTVGSGTGTNTLVPINTNYGYNYTQSIYTPAQLNMPSGTVITKISFLPQTTVAPATWASLCKDWVVYLGNTTTTSFGTTTSWVPVSGLTQVYQGVVGAPTASSWLEVSFSTPFTYTGGNLIIAVDENTPGYTSVVNWSSFTGASNTTIYYYSDGTNPSPSAPPTASSRGTSLPQIKLSSPAACSGAPATGTISAPIACANSNFNLSVSPDEYLLGMTYAWESASSVNGPWTPEASTSPIGTLNMPAGTKFFRRVTTCANGNGTAATTPVSVTAYQNMSGGYTVGGAGADFTNLTSAISALACGIAGDVTLNVNPGTYNESVDIAGYANPSNYRLTIQPNPANTGVVEFSTDLSTGYVFQLNARNNVVLRGLKITASGTTAGTLIRYNGVNTNILIENCQLIGNTTSTNGIYHVSTSTDRLSGNIRNNQISNVSNGVYLNMAPNLVFNVARNNISALTYGIYAYARVTGPTVRIDSNTVEATSSTGGYGVYIYGTSTLQVSRALLRNNTIKGNLQALTLGFTISTAASPSEIINNVITDYDNTTPLTSQSRGLYCYVIGNVNIYHNSILITAGSPTTGRAAYFNGATNPAATTQVGVNFANNVVVNKGTGRVMSIESTSYPTFSTLNNNTYWGLGAITSQFTYGGDKTSYATYVSSFAGGRESSSTNADPEYNSNTDLTPQGFPVSNNAAPVGVLTDFSGAARSSTTPDRGAYEFTYYACKRPSNIQLVGRGVSSLDLTWTTLNPSKFGTVFRYRKQGVQNWTRQVIFGSASSARIAGLAANSTYEVFLYELCSASDSSLLTSSAINGTTLCSYSTLLPIAQNFEGTTPISGCTVTYPGSLTTGWSVQGPSTSSGPAVASEGSKYAYLVPTSPSVSNPYSLELQGRALPTAPKQLVFDYWVGAGNRPFGNQTTSSTSSTVTPYTMGEMDARQQYMIRADELQRLLGANSGIITSLSFNVTALPSCAGCNNIFNGFTISAASTTNTDLASPLPSTAFTTVFAPANGLEVTSLGWNTHTFSTPFAWDGISNVVFQVCFDNSAYGSNGGVATTSTTWSSVYYSYADLPTSGGCSVPLTSFTSKSTTTTRPNMQFGFVAGQAVAPLFSSPLKLQASTDDGLTWTDEFGVNLPTVSLDSWNTAEVNLSNFANGNVRFRFVGNSAGSTSTNPKMGLAIDRITTEEFNACKRPGNLGLANVTIPVKSNSVSLSWAQGASSETAWELEYGAVGHVPGSGVIVPTSSRTNVVVTGLTGSTTYEVYVRAVCSSASTSAWVGPFSVTTSCPQAQVSSIAESFESTPWSFTASPRTISPCWSASPRSNGSTYGWEIWSGTVTSSGTGPSAAATGSNYMYVETSSGSTGQMAYLMLPEYTFVGQVFPKFSFKYHMFGATMGTMNPQISIDGGETWVNLDTLTGQQQTSSAAAWNTLDLSLRAYANASSVFLRIAYAKGTSFTGDIAVDDVRVYDGCTVSLATSTVQNVNCHNEANGEITLVATGANGLAEFAAGSTGPWGSTTSYENLVAGNYTYLVRDAFGCLNSQTFTVTQPAVLASTATSVAADCFGANSASLNATFTGGTAPYSYEWSLASDTAFDETTEDLASIVAGQYSVHLTDANGCEFTQNYTVSQAPQIVATTVTTSTVSCTSVDGSASIAVTGGTGSKSITWDTPTPQTGLSITGLPPGLYTATITDGNNCVVTFEQRINASDSVGSQVVSSTNVTCLGQANGLASITNVGGEAPYSYRWNTNPIQTTATATNLPAGTYIGRVIDNKGCSSQRTVVIGISDAVAPTLVTKPATISLNSAGVATLNAGDVILTATDNCGIVSTSLSKSTFDCADKGANTVNVTVVDGNGNTTTVAAQVQVVDLVAPTLNTSSAPLVLSLGANGTVAFNASSAVNAVTDNCGTVTVSAPTVTYSCAQVGLQSVNVTATDASGNTTTGTVYVLVQDNAAPVLTANTNVSVYLNASGTASVTAANLGTAVDNCTPTSGLVTTLSKSTFNCADRGVEPVAMTVADAAGNVATATINVTVLDTIKPALTSVASLSAPLNAQGVATISMSQLNISSTDNCGSVTVNTSSLTFGCSNLGANTIQIVSKDAAGNMRTRNVAVTVTDAIAPSLSVTATPVVLALNASGQATLTSAVLVNSVSDNCSSAPTVTLSKSTFTCADKGSNNVTVTATDAAGNATTRTATVVVMDLAAPTITVTSAPVTVTLSATGQGSVTLAQLGSATDNCSGVTLVASKLQFTCAEVGSQVVTLTATDASGNVTTATKTVTVIDNSAPVLVATPSNTTVGDCASQVSYAYTVTDNCGFTVKRTSGLPSGSTFPLGATVVTHEFKDGAGNITTHSFTVTVVNGAPSVPTIPNLCPSDAPVSLGSVQGLTITGPGVVNGTFNPALANAGNNVLNYTFTASNGCVYTGVINAFVNASPAQPTVTLLPGGLLDANTIATSYQWFFNGSSIATGVNKIQPVVGLGRYQVEITNTLGCSTTSDEVTYNGSSLGAEELGSLDLRVYPVPATHFVNIAGLSGSKVEGIQVYTLGGQVLSVPFAANQSDEIQMNTSALPSGLYLVRVTSTEGETRVVRFEIVK